MVRPLTESLRSGSFRAALLGNPDASRLDLGLAEGLVGGRILQELATVQMHAIPTSGNCVRNVTSHPFAGVARWELERFCAGPELANGYEQADIEARSTCSPAGFCVRNGPPSVGGSLSG